MLFGLLAIGIIRKNYSKMNGTIKYLTSKPSSGAGVLCSSLLYTRNI